jgi:predicted DNA-binding ribbon-helix-helix protein
MTGKRVQFDEETWQALALLARDRMMDFQELADEAFRDLLHKHGRPSDLKSALRQSVGQDTATDVPKRTPRKGRSSGA